MKSIELVVANLDEAKAKAASKLGVPEDQIQIEVLEESKGLFGRPGKLTIRASAEDSAEATAEAPKGEKPKKAVKSAKPEKAESTEKKAEKPAKGAKVEKAAKPAKEEPAEEGVPSTEEEGDFSDGVSDRPEAVATQEDADKMVGYLTELLELADMEATVSCSGINGRYVNIKIDGKDVGYLIGRRGEVLNAIQYMMNVISGRQLHNGVRIVLEADNYRQKRADALTEMAQKIAAEVVKRGEEAVLDALPAFERRVIHQALVDFEGVTTYSEGEEPDRRVVIGPE